MIYSLQNITQALLADCSALSARLQTTVNDIKQVFQERDAYHSEVHQDVFEVWSKCFVSSQPNLF